MPEIYVPIESDLLKVVTECLERTARDISEDPPIHPSFPDDDPELANSWIESLTQSLELDCAHLLALLDDPHFGTEPVKMDLNSIESVSRAASALRLKIRDSELIEISDKALEEETVDLKKLNKEEQKAYATFTFLAALQEAVIKIVVSYLPKQPMA